jgi:hypothetical protein
MKSPPTVAVTLAAGQSDSAAASANARLVRPGGLTDRARWYAVILVIALFLLVVLDASSGRSQALPDDPAADATGGPEAFAPTLDYDLRFAAYDNGRMLNAAIPFTHGPVWAAQPFIFTGSDEDREHATTCLASAVWYEAGDDEAGEQAVAQVVVNRVRHPVFPKTVCGVVFQRTTGNCQFTFTCDGSFRRVPSIAAWQRARAIAERALLGFVYAPVGTATFYHADYVVPYWSKTFDKIARVKAHLFYRLRGALGLPNAFVGRYQGYERIDPRLLALNQAIRGIAGPLPGEPGLIATSAAASVAAAVAPAEAAVEIPGANLRGSILRLMNNATGQYVLQLDPAAFPGSYAVAALSLCRDKPECTVMGWLQPQLIPASISAAMATMPTLSFIYRKDATRGLEQFSWNCRQVARSDPKQCMPGTGSNPAA